MEEGGGAPQALLRGVDVPVPRFSDPATHGRKDSGAFPADEAAGAPVNPDIEGLASALDVCAEPPGLSGLLDRSVEACGRSGVARA